MLIHFHSSKAACDDSGEFRAPDREGSNDEPKRLSWGLAQSLTRPTAPVPFANADRFTKPLDLGDCVKP
jgi:hypothetical protein